MTTERSTDVIVSDTQTGPVAYPGGPLAAMQSFNAAIGRNETNVFAHNFEGSMNDQLRLMSIATSGDCQRSDDFIGRDFTFTNWFVHRVELANEKTGEVVNVPRVVLISADGEAIQFVSLGVAETLRMILSFIGTGSIPDGFRVTIKQRQTRHGYKILYLQPNPLD